MKLDRFSDGMELTVQDVRILLRWLPAFFIVCLIGLAIGIGVTVYQCLSYQSPSISQKPGTTPQEQPQTSPDPSLPIWYNGVFRIVAGSRGGSGFLVRSNYVVTNAHVVDGAADRQVTLYFTKDYKESNFRGNIVWQGISNGGKEDLALIEVPHQDKSLVCPIGNSAQVGKTEDVLALGYPLGADTLITPKGTISGILRTSKLFQTDAAANMGSSGGPLVSLKQNKVIGILVSEGDQVDGQRVTEGTNYAIMIDYAMTEIQKHIEVRK